MSAASAPCPASTWPSIASSAAKWIWSPRSASSTRPPATEYRAFLVDKNIRLGTTDGWRHFVMLSAKSTSGRRAMHAYRRHRQLALGATAKLRVLEDILKAHPRDRVLIFTNDNETVHQISRTFLVPAITHRTRTRERKGHPRGLQQGRIPRPRRLKSAQRGRQYPRSQRRGGPLRLGHHPRSSSSASGASSAVAKARRPYSTK